MNSETKEGQTSYPCHTINYNPPDTLFDKIESVVIIASTIGFMITIVAIIGHLIYRMF